MYHWLWSVVFMLCLSSAAWGLTAADIVDPENSGYTPSEMAALFRDSATSVNGYNQVALIWQFCSSCKVYIEQYGNDNMAFIFQSTDGSEANIIQQGSGRQGIVQSGGVALSVIVQTPGTNGNIAIINQSSSVAVTSWR